VKHRERKRQNQRIGSNSTRKGTAKNTKRKRGTGEKTPENKEKNKRTGAARRNQAAEN